jgi:hypothetical protein
MFTNRPAGTTLRRVEDAIIHPHPANERFDPEFPVAMHCNRCGKLGFGPRKHMREALVAHWEEDCPARRSQADAPKEMRLLYPRAKE